MDDDLDICSIRKEMGLSQAGLGALMGVDQSTVSHWESEKHQPRGPARGLIQRLLADHRAGLSSPHIRAREDVA